MVRALREGEQIPLPAEDLSADDDLLSWILVDQLGCLPNTKLGVHPQEVKFIGPPFKNSEVMAIVQECVVKSPDLREATRRLLDFHLIKAHYESKITEGQRLRFTQHIQRYLMPILPTSRIEIFTTDRYTSVTGHVELAVYATRPLPTGTVVEEVQGSIVPFPKSWSDEMDLVEEYEEAAVEEDDSDDEEVDEEEAETDRADSRDQRDGTGTGLVGTPTKRGKRKKEHKGARRSHRTKRRDFSVIWSNSNKGYLLFLGPARFLNHDCDPNVALYRKGRKYVTFTVIRPIRVGEEITTYYGNHYFGKDNIECLCLTCEKQCKGGFTGKSIDTALAQRAQSPTMSASTRYGSPASTRKAIRPSALRNALGDLSVTSQADDDDVGQASTAGPSGTSHDDSLPVTPRKIRPQASLLSIGGADSPATDATSEPGSPTDCGPPKRERYRRKAAEKAQKFSFLKRPKKILPDEPELFMDGEEEECDRCATCAKALRAPIWYQNTRFDHCARCVRHSLIFDLPWPAHNRSQVLDYPPLHLIPFGYVPPRISSIPLPSLDKNRKKHSEPAPIILQNGSLFDRQACQTGDLIALQQLQLEQLWEAALTAEETAANAVKSAQEAKAETERKKIAKEAKRLKGSGVWQYWEYADEEEEKRKELARHAMTTGTRRGGRYKANFDEEEERRLAEKIVAERLALAAAAEQEEAESDADDEAEGNGVEEAGDTGKDPGVIGDLGEDIKPVISPEKSIKAEPPNSPKTKEPPPPDWVMYVGDSSDDEVEVIDAEQYRVTAEKANRKRTGNPDPGEKLQNELGESLVEVADKSTRFAKKTQVGSDGTAKSPVHVPSSSPMRPQARTKANRKNAPRPVTHGTARDPVDFDTAEKAPRPVTHGTARDPVAVDATKKAPRLVTHSTSQDPLDADSTAVKDARGRGRPKGTGKIQKAAKMLAGRVSPAAIAGPSKTSKQRTAPEAAVKEREDQPEIHLGIEETLGGWAEDKSDLHYEYLIEGLDTDGTTCMKSTNKLGQNLFDGSKIINDYIAKERSEYRTYHFNPDSSLDGDGPPTPVKEGPKLPGHNRLLSSAEVKAWSPCRPGEDSAIWMPIYAPDGKQIPKNIGKSITIVGIVIDPSTGSGYGRPSTTEGPWLNGQYRLVGARTVIAHRHNIEALWNEKMGDGQSKPVDRTPIKNKPKAKQVTNGVKQASASGERNARPNGVPHNTATPSKSASKPASKRGTPIKHIIAEINSIAPKKARTPNITPSAALPASESVQLPTQNVTTKSTSMVNRDDTGNSASTSLAAEEEVEQLLSGDQNQKRRLSLEDSPPRTKTKYGVT